jgi:hypothetical protein
VYAKVLSRVRPPWCAIVLRSRTSPDMSSLLYSSHAQICLAAERPIPNDNPLQSPIQIQKRSCWLPCFMFHSLLLLKSSHVTLFTRSMVTSQGCCVRLSKHRTTSHVSKCQVHNFLACILCRPCCYHKAVGKQIYARCETLHVKLVTVG